MGLEGFEDRQARKLSGGQAQRIGIARALVVRPVLLLADEPTANLDPDTARQVGRVLLEAARDTALVVATHDRALAAQCDRILRWEDLGAS